MAEYRMRHTGYRHLFIDGQNSCVCKRWTRDQTTPDRDWDGGFTDQDECVYKHLSPLSPAAPTVTNAAGGKQSDVGVRMDLVPPKALLQVAQVLKHGAEKYGEKNWESLSIPEILNHVLVHLYGYLDGNTEDDHLGHAACRILMALELDLRKKGEKK